MDSQDNPNKKTPQGDRHSEEMSPQDYLRQIKANYPDLKQNMEMKVWQNLEGVTQTITVEDLIKKKKNALYFKSCKNCHFKLANNLESVKIMIEHCEGSSFSINGVVKTGVVELWRSKNMILDIGTEIGTLQVDLTDSLVVNYSSKSYLGSIVQAGINELKVNFENHPELNFVSGLEVLKKEHADLDDKFDQFITRFVEGNLLTEMIVRYADGFTTTDREKAKEDGERDKNESATVDKIRNMLKIAGPALGLDEENLVAKSTQGKAESAKKVEAESQANLKKHAGNKAFTAGKFDQALALYTEALGLAPDNHILYSNRAATYQQLKELEKALMDAEKCIELKKEFTKGHFRRGLILLDLGRKEEAVKSLVEAHDLEPKDEEINAALTKAKQ
jgi:hypothetical protein